MGLSMLVAACAACLYSQAKQKKSCSCVGSFGVLANFTVHVFSWDAFADLAVQKPTCYVACIHFIGIRSRLFFFLVFLAADELLVARQKGRTRPP